MDESQRERIREALADFVNKTFRTEGGNKTGYIELLAEIDKQKRLQNLKNRDLASMIGFSENTINCFMTGNRWSKAVAEKLCEALKLPAELAS